MRRIYDQHDFKCEVCHTGMIRVSEFDDEGRWIDAWWRCLTCQMEFGIKQPIRGPDGEQIIYYLWKRNLAG